MHDCIQCGCACYCHGDIDDCVVETWQYSAAHCTGCGCHEDPDAFDDDDDDEDDDGEQAEPATDGVPGGHGETFPPDMPTKSQHAP